MFTVKSSKWFISSLILTGTLGLAGAKVMASDNASSRTGDRPYRASNGVLSKTPLAQGSDYCHLRFPAMRPSTMGTDHPQLKSPESGDIVDFYGPCNHDPLGREEMLSQEQQRQLLLDRSFDG